MLSQQYERCFENILKYKLSASKYDCTKPNNNRYQAQYTHDLFSLFHRLHNLRDISYQDNTNIQNYLCNSITWVQNNRDITIPSNVKNNLKYLDYMQPDTQNFLQTSIKVLTDNNFTFDDGFYEKYDNYIKNGKNVDWGNTFYWLIQAHIQRLFNKFYYVWMETPYQYTQDINAFGESFSPAIQFIPHDSSSVYLNKILNDLLKIYNNVNELKKRIYQIEVLASKYVNSPIDYQSFTATVTTTSLPKPVVQMAPQPKIDYSNYTMDHLKKLCNERKIQITGKGTVKQSYIDALMK